MKNFPIIDKETGREYWISRSVAVVAFVVAYSKENLNDEFILAVQRGKGTPDPEYVGKWCLPCGYLDFDETLEEAVIREVWEETGVKLNIDNVLIHNINSDPKSDKRQNVTARFKCIISPKDGYIEALKLSNENSELDEVSDIKFISYKDINKYKWAFNHSYLINEFFDSLP